MSSEGFAPMLREVTIHVVADSTGDTGARVARAVQAQYPDLDSVNVVRHPRITDQDSMSRALATITHDNRNTIVFLTMVDLGLRSRALSACAAIGVPCIDIMAPVLNAVTARTGAHPARVVQPVGLAADYFERIHAMEFAIANDDGNLSDSLEEAEIVLVGASRTGKTPLSMYLGYLGYPTANVPLVMGVEPPKELFETAPYKIIGLTIDPERLLSIRRRRVEDMGAAAAGGARLGGYADLAKILDELDYVAAIQKRLKCPVFDTTKLALEEAAGRITETVAARRRALGEARAPADPQ
jgi:regulator of PEP synthase PpsR (kinase-PPPase family)